MEFARGGVVCIPQDIAILHKERYCYPKKDSKGRVTMEPMWHREVSKYYCVKKDCILRRLPYFWKGMVEPDRPRCKSELERGPFETFKGGLAIVRLILRSQVVFTKVTGFT